ncbi:MAG: hypothetical protein KGL39_48280 [Patescibacteria group bacterium]|nr:hypothetical protein [Patescibacteria group bacterium]
MSCSIFKLTSAATTNLTAIGNMPNTDLYGYNIVNTVASARYVKFYWGVPGHFSSSNDNPTVGTDTPLLTVQVPASGTATAQFNIPIGNNGSLFMATTTTAPDNGSTAVGAGDLIISIYFG